MTPPPAFLFDLDGTLADTLPDIAASTNFVRQQHDLPPLPDQIVRRYIGDGARKLLERALHEVLPAAAPAVAKALDAAFASYAEHHREQCTGLATLFAGARQHLTELHQRGHPLAIVTNKPEAFAIPLAQHLGLDSLVGAIVGGDTVAQKKPDPTPLQHALAQLSAAAQGATMVGDGLQDLRAGKALGLRTIACLFGYGDPQALRAEGATTFWREFATPE